MYTPGFARRDNQADRQYLPDWRGSTRYVTDAAGAVRGEARYDAFGQQMAGSALGTPHQFAGGWGYEREENGALGLDYLYQRYYDPAAGRFISRDPIGWAGGLNLYGYCGNDPVNGVDPEGLFWREILGIAGGISGGAAGAAAGGIGAVPGAAVGTGLGSYLGGRLDGLTPWEALPGAFLEAGTTYFGGKLLSSIGPLAKLPRRNNLLQSIANGKWGESQLAAIVTGVSHRVFHTPLGDRVVDILSGGIAHEAKVGYTCLTSFIQKQLNKDAQLLAGGQVSGVEWHFFSSPTTGKVGPSAELQKELTLIGIHFIIHP